MKTTQKQLNELYKQYFTNSELKIALEKGNHSVGTYEENVTEINRCARAMKTISNIITK